MVWFLKANQMAVAKDTLGALREWLGISAIIILEKFSNSFQQSLNPSFLRILDRFMERFSLLMWLLSYVLAFNRNQIYK